MRSYYITILADEFYRRHREYMTFISRVEVQRAIREAEIFLESIKAKFKDYKKLEKVAEKASQEVDKNLGDAKKLEKARKAAEEARKVV